MDISTVRVTLESTQEDGDFDGVAFIAGTFSDFTAGQGVLETLTPGMRYTQEYTSNDGRVVRTAQAQQLLQPLALRITSDTPLQGPATLTVTVQPAEEGSIGVAVEYRLNIRQADIEITQSDKMGSFTRFTRNNDMSLILASESDLQSEAGVRIDSTVQVTATPPDNLISSMRVTLESHQTAGDFDGVMFIAETSSFTASQGVLDTLTPGLRYTQEYTSDDGAGATAGEAQALLRTLALKITSDTPLEGASTLTVTVQPARDLRDAAVVEYRVLITGDGEVGPVLLEVTVLAQTHTINEDDRIASVNLVRVTPTSTSNNQNLSVKVNDSEFIVRGESEPNSRWLGNGDPEGLFSVVVFGPEELATVRFQAGSLRPGARSLRPDAHGTATFTYMVIDANSAGRGETRPLDFMLTVTPVNDTPVITVVSPAPSERLILAAGGGPSTVTVTLSDVDLSEAEGNVNRFAQSGDELVMSVDTNDVTLNLLDNLGLVNVTDNNSSRIELIFRPGVTVNATQVKTLVESVQVRASAGAEIGGRVLTIALTTGVNEEGAGMDERLTGTGTAQVLVVNESPAFLNASVENLQENDPSVGGVTLTLSRELTEGESVTVTYTLDFSAGSAVATDVADLSAGTARASEGQSTVVISLRANPDETTEGEESFNVNLATAVFGAEGEADQAIPFNTISPVGVTIAADDVIYPSTALLTRLSDETLEGQSLRFRIELSDPVPAGETLTIGYLISGDPNVSDQLETPDDIVDFGNAVIGEGRTTGVFSVPIRNDSVVENDEGGVLRLQSASFNNPELVLNIFLTAQIDPDTLQQFSFTISDATRMAVNLDVASSVTEGFSGLLKSIAVGVTAADVTLARDVAVRLQIGNPVADTARGGRDYVQLSGSSLTLTFSEGEALAASGGVINVIPDSIVEPGGTTVTITLHDSQIDRAVMAGETSRTVVTIFDNDLRLSVERSSPEVTEGGDEAVIFMMRLLGTAEHPRLNVDYMVMGINSDDLRTPLSQSSGLSSMVQFAATGENGSMLRTLTYHTESDDLVEGPETAQIRVLQNRLSFGLSLEGGLPEASTSTVVMDNTPPLRVSFSEATYEFSENHGNPEVVLNVRSGAVGSVMLVSPVSVSVVTEDGTASELSDYTARPDGGPLVEIRAIRYFLHVPRSGRIQIPLTIMDDTEVERNETFILRLSVPGLDTRAVTDTTNVATVTIQNDDVTTARVVFNPQAVTVERGESSVMTTVSLLPLLIPGQEVMLALGPVTGLTVNSVPIIVVTLDDATTSQVVMVAATMSAPLGTHEVAVRVSGSPAGATVTTTPLMVTVDPGSIDITRGRSVIPVREPELQRGIVIDDGVMVDSNETFTTVRVVLTGDAGSGNLDRATINGMRPEAEDDLTFNVIGFSAATLQSFLRNLRLVLGTEDPPDVATVTVTVRPAAYPMAEEIILAYRLEITDTTEQLVLLRVETEDLDEDSPDDGGVTLTFSRALTRGESVTVDYTLNFSGASATVTDVVGASAATTGTVTLTEADQTDISIPLRAVDDDLDEGPETFRVQLTAVFTALFTVSEVSDDMTFVVPNLRNPVPLTILDNDNRNDDVRDETVVFNPRAVTVERGGSSVMTTVSLLPLLIPGQEVTLRLRPVTGLTVNNSSLILVTLDDEMTSQVVTIAAAVNAPLGTHEVAVEVSGSPAGATVTTTPLMVTVQPGSIVIRRGEGRDTRNFREPELQSGIFIDGGDDGVVVDSNETFTTVRVVLTGDAGSGNLVGATINGMMPEAEDDLTFSVIGGSAAQLQTLLRNLRLVLGTDDPPDVATVTVTVRPAAYPVAEETILTYRLEITDTTEPLALLRVETEDLAEGSLVGGVTLTLSRALTRGESVTVDYTLDFSGASATATDVVGASAATTGTVTLAEVGQTVISIPLSAFDDRVDEGEDPETFEVQLTAVFTALFTASDNTTFDVSNLSDPVQLTILDNDNGTTAIMLRLRIFLEGALQ